MGVRDGQDWIILAHDDLRAAQILADIPHQQHNACFHAQWSAEKALKAVLLAYGIHFPKTHDIEFLIDLLRQHDATFPAFSEAAAVLDQYNTDARYKRHFRDRVDAAEAQDAIHYAQPILALCQERVNPPAFE